MQTLGTTKAARDSNTENVTGASAINSFYVVHRCDKCLHPSLPRDLNQDATITGLFVCPVCGHAGPLRPEIIALTNNGGSEAQSNLDEKAQAQL